MNNISFATLVNGATVVSVSPHGYRFSDGTTCNGNKDLADKLTASRKMDIIKTIKGMRVNKVSFSFSNDQLNLLQQICNQFDIVIVPFLTISALNDMGIRDQFPNAVAFNATADTMRASPQDKVVDINNWSY